MNYTPGFYWVLSRNNPKPTVARLSKDGGWEYMVSEHSHKLVGNKPYKILEKIEPAGEKVGNYKDDGEEHNWQYRKEWFDD